LRLSDIVLSKIYAADFVVNLNQRLLPRRPIPKTNISRGRRLEACPEGEFAAEMRTPTLGTP
jgi:hypothetical protein